MSRLLAFALAVALSPAVALAGMLAALSGQALAAGADNTLTRVAFGSCARETKKQPIWKPIISHKPDLFIFLGDNIYADTRDMNVMRKKYKKLASISGFKKLKKTTPIIATWDDHDYGENDAGMEYPNKVESKRIFLDFFAEPEDSERRTRDGGIYTSYLYGTAGKRVQVILLDTRYDRTPLLKVDPDEYKARKAKNMGPYLPNRDKAARMLGEDQWAWLEEQLKVPADVRIVGTGIPFLIDFTGWETWANFPHERERLIKLIEKTKANGLFFISGDTHWAEFSKRTEAAPYPLWEFTSSGLTEEWKDVGPNKNRLGDFYWQNNFGLIKINWDGPDPEITLEIRNVKDDLVMQNTLRLSELSIK